MADWWYGQGGKEYGPFSEEFLGGFLAKGVVTKETLVWREGMGEWQPLGNVEELHALVARTRPPLPASTPPLPGATPAMQKPSPPKPSYEAAGVWRRFWARTLDVWIFFLPASFLMGMGLGIIGAGEWLLKPSNDILFALLMVPVALLFDSIAYTMFGNTPGKALLGLRVRTIDGQPLTSAQYVDRNFMFWLHGYGLGLPLVSAITLYIQSRKVRNEGATTYDRKLGFTVESRQVSPLNYLVFAGLIFILLIAYGIFNQTTKPEVDPASNPFEQFDQPAPYP